MRKEAPPFICSELETQNLFDNLQLLPYREASNPSLGIPTKLRRRKEEITSSSALLLSTLLIYRLVFLIVWVVLLDCSCETMRLFIYIFQYAHSKRA